MAILIAATRHARPLPAIEYEAYLRGRHLAGSREAPATLHHPIATTASLLPLKSP